MTAPDRRITPRSAQEWGAVAPVWLGMGGLVFQLVLWAVTAVVMNGDGIVEPAMLTAFGGLLAIGQGAQALAALRTPPPDPHDPVKEDTSSSPPTPSS